MLAFLAGLIIALQVTAPSAADRAPWAGTWRLNPEKSTAQPGPRTYARTTLRIEALDDGLRVSYDMVGTRGGRTHLEWRGDLDGRDYPLQGLDSVVTNAYRLVDARTYEITIKVDGRLAATTLVTVAPDGQTLTAVTTDRDAEGHTLPTTEVYDRR